MKRIENRWPRPSTTLLALTAFIFNIFSIASHAAWDESLEDEYANLLAATPQPTLSVDGNTLYNAVQPVIYIADPNPAGKRTQSREDFQGATSDIPPPDESTAIWPNETTDTGLAAATFVIDYIAAGGSDLWGERCYTFPEGAKAAFNAAAAIWSNTLQSNVPITIKACWASLSSSSILGYSGGGSSHKNFANAPRSNTLYSASLANSLAGEDLDTHNHDMHITYNSSFDWYYGTDGNPPSNQSDLVTVVLHEIAHGLNFAGTMSYSSGVGSYGFGTSSPGIYDVFMRNGAGTSLTSYASGSTALGSQLVSNNIWFHGANAMSANGGARVKIYAPSTWNGGSSYSHLDYSTFNNTANQLMVYAISAGEAVHDPGPITKGIFKDLGWNQASSGGGKAVMTSPTSGSTLAGSSQTFSWTNAGAAQYWLYVGTSAGANNLYNQSQGTNTSETVTGLPTNGGTLYVRLWTYLSTGWAYNDYTYKAASGGSGGTPYITTPSAGSTLGGSSQTFAWTPNGQSVSQYWMYIGTSAGANNIYNSGNLGTATSKTVTGLPTNGSTLYVRLYANYGGSWKYKDHTYKAASGGSGGTPYITAPSTGSTLGGSSQTFNWTPNGQSVSQYWMYIGTSAGANNIYNSGNLGTATSKTVTGLPTNGSTLYVRLYANYGGSWKYKDHTYKAASGGGSGGTPYITAPSTGSTLGGSSQTFNWTPNGQSVSQYWMYIGTSAGANNIYNSGNLGAATSKTVTGLPTNGSTLYVRLYANYGGSWKYKDHTYTAASSGGSGGGFNSQFNGSASEWYRLSAAANWSISSSAFYYTAGAVSEFASTYHGSSSDAQTMYGDFDYQAKLWRNGCEDCSNGIMFRGNQIPSADGYWWDHGYAFLYSRDGWYAIFKTTDGVATALVDWKESSAINQGSNWNTLRVVASGGTVYFYINGTSVGTLSNASYTSGKAGLIMYRDSESSGNGLWVDWATLVPTTNNIVASSEADTPMIDEAAAKDIPGDATGTGEQPAGVYSDGAETSLQ